MTTLRTAAKQTTVMTEPKCQNFVSKIQILNFERIALISFFKIPAQKGPKVKMSKSS